MTLSSLKAKMKEKGKDLLCFIEWHDWSYLYTTHLHGQPKTHTFRCRHCGTTEVTEGHLGGWPK